MQIKKTIMVLGAALLAATLAWGAAEPQIRAEIRGVRTWMDELQAAGKGTSLESAMPFFPLTVKKAVGVDLVNLLEGGAMAAATVYADMGLLDAAADDFDDFTGHGDKMEAFAESVVAVCEFVPKDVDRFWAAWERTYPNKHSGEPPREGWRVFEIDIGVPIYGVEIGDGRVFIAAGGNADITEVVLADAVEAAAADGGWKLSVPGTFAAGCADYTALGRAYAKFFANFQAMAAGSDQPVALEAEPSFRATEVGVALAGDILRVRWLLEPTPGGVMEEVVEFLRSCPPFAAGDAVQVVDRPGALMVAECRYCGNPIAPLAKRQFERQMEMFRQMAGYTGDDKAMPRIYGDLVEAFAHLGNGSAGMALMPRGGRERGLPPAVVYYSGIVDAPACREALARIAAGWPRSMLERYCSDWDLADEDVPVSFRLLGSRELACAEVDTYELSFPDVPVNREIFGEGVELPLEIGLVEFAWAPGSQLLVSTLAPAEFDQVLVDLQDGNFRSIRDNPRFAELLSAPGEDELEGGYVTMNVIDLLRDAVDWVADWAAVKAGKDFRKNETFARFWAGLPDAPGFVAARTWRTPDGRWADEMAAPLAPLREAWISCFSVGLDLAFGAVRDASAAAERAAAAAGGDPDEDCDPDGEPAPAAD